MIFSSLFVSKSRTGDSDSFSWLISKRIMFFYYLYCIIIIWNRIDSHQHFKQSLLLNEQSGNFKYFCHYVELWTENQQEEVPISFPPVGVTPPIESSVFVVFWSLDETLGYNSTSEKPEEFNPQLFYSGNISYAIVPQTVQQRELETVPSTDLNSVGTVRFLKDMWLFRMESNSKWITPLWMHLILSIPFQGITSFHNHYRIQQILLNLECME